MVPLLTADQITRNIVATIRYYSSTPYGIVPVATSTAGNRTVITWSGQPDATAYTLTMGFIEVPLPVAIKPPKNKPHYRNFGHKKNRY